jgi:alpha-aminoadipate/glutamate carrier protein LysW
MNTKTSTTHPCPECAAPLAMPTDTLQGEILSCEECAADLEIIALEPLCLALAPEVDEDWGE